MHWANFLHIYQPANQQKSILDAVIAECYRPLLINLKKTKGVKITLNINASLVELFHKNGYQDLIDLLKELGKDGKIEFTSSAKFHAFLPLLPRDEVIRQIQMNDETNKLYLGDAYNPKGFFSPEMGFSDELPSIIKELGYEWMILDEITAYGEVGKIDYTKLYKIKGTELHVFFRERRISNLIMGAIVRSPESLIETMKDDLRSKRYLITGMDGETFGHHRPGLEKMLFEIFETKDFKLIGISELLNLYKEIVEISPIKSTWASSKQDIELGIQFLSWNDPENILHTWQWELIHLTLNHVMSLDTKSPHFYDIRKKMDRALGSDHLWWASAKPWWSVEMIEDGCFRLLDTLRSIADLKESELAEASRLYEKIVSTAFEWQRTGKIHEMMHQQKSTLRIPLKDRSLVVGGVDEGTYHPMLQLMANLEEKAIAKREYEKAILWRNAAYKLENKLDIYETINAVDLLRTEIPNDEITKLIEEYKKPYYKIRGGQPEQRGS